MRAGGCAGLGGPRPFPFAEILPPGSGKEPQFPGGWRHSQPCGACLRVPPATCPPGTVWLAPPGPLEQLGDPQPRAGGGALWSPGQEVTELAIESSTGLGFCHIVSSVFCFLNKKVDFKIGNVLM